ncbi:glycoside hydrolase family 3 N-terminal domain-containing protein [Streptomyces sp. NPDC055400]
MSDYDALPMLVQDFHTATTPGQAAVQSLTAGIDVVLPHGKIYEQLGTEVESGRLDEKVVDQAVHRVLRAKARVGLIPSFGPRRPRRQPRIRSRRHHRPGRLRSR